MRERRTTTADPRDAIAASAGVVTSAAVIMIAVFTVFITLSVAVGGADVVPDAGVLAGDPTRSPA
ncbi:hypothetical protein [Micromonospora sp. KC723]|uniref:hypothetical protein n=1 Tax=Micromonospora sp. KC723 TaxID=2530381 RepID=UPI00352DA53D